MQVRLLGTAAGGGVPQWNCNCPVCKLARENSGAVVPRTQSSVAVSAEGKHWFLLNASPDIRSQVERFPVLQPSGGATRGSPIEGVLLTNSDVDHTLGLLLLREGEPLAIHATAATQAVLALSVETVLKSFCGLQWTEPPYQSLPLLRRDGQQSGLR